MYDFSGTSVSGTWGRADAAAAVLWIVITSGLARLAVAACVGLSVDESYTVAIGRQLALSYFDHPPLHVWLVHAWTRLVGSELPVLARMPFIALFAGSTLLMYHVTAAMFGARAGFWAAMALNLAPLFTVGTASWVLPDGPLVFFSLLMVWLLIRVQQAAETPHQSQLMLWLAAGACAGLALLSKYLAVFPLVGLGLFLLTSRHRRLLATPAPWLALMLAALLFTPVLGWNAEHGWVSFTFQGGRALPGQLSISRLLLEVSGQLAYLLPWTGVALVYVLVQAVRHGPRDEAKWLFACLAIGPIGFFALAGLWTQVLPHWPAIGWLFAFPLLGNELARLELERERLPGRLALATTGVLVALLVLVASQARSGWMDRFVRSFPASDPTVDVLDWNGLQLALQSRHLMGPGLFVATVSWIDGGKVDYALGGQMPVLCLSRDPRGFAFLRDEREFAGRDAVIVANARRADWQRLAQAYFQRIEPLADVQLQRASGPALTLKLARGIGLKPSLDSAGSAAARP
jgi:4-amino-4-deoxy-L-arabinose transferase-like glycosyltransferase